MIAIEVNINVLLFAAIILAAAAIGFFFRSQQISSYKRKMVELEKEMLSNHSEILELQRQNAQLGKQMKEMHIPVITMKKSRDDKSDSRAQ